MDDAMSMISNGHQPTNPVTECPTSGPGETEDTAEDFLAQIRANEDANHATVLGELAKEYERLGEPKNGKMLRLDVKSIERDPALQMRAHLDDSAIADYDDKYVREMKGLKGLNKDERLFPLVELFELAPGKYTVVNGWHRLAAMVKAGLSTWLFAVQSGDIREAAKYAAAANRTNVAVRVTNADKRQMVVSLWAIFPNLASRRIGEMAGVDHHTAERHRPKGTEDQPREGKGGRTYKPQGKSNGKKERIAVAPLASNNSVTATLQHSLVNLPRTGEIPQNRESAPNAANDLHANDVEALAASELTMPSMSPESPSGRNPTATDTLIAMSVSVGPDTAWQRIAIDGHQLAVRVVAVEGDVATVHFLDGGAVAVAASG